ncbi:MAG: Hydrogenase isoenzymes formation protein HypD [Syntrophus sp. PtaU1.Bin208]|nr:MAG: Hydrogenase isoenzymes formation protein HypD [Syntrophus sp. PtaU1.Bin208]
MRFIDEYRDPDLVRKLLDAVKSLAARIGRPITLMEICGTHTHAIGRFGIRRLLPENIRLISGPGCPVCVTSISDVDRALYLAERPNVLFATFGDMLRVPGTGGRRAPMSVLSLRPWTRSPSPKPIRDERSFFWESALKRRRRPWPQRSKAPSGKD